MHYYEVNVSGQSYHGHEALTYSSDHELPIGSVVSVPLRQKNVPGIVVRKTPKPRFAAKQVHQLLLENPLPHTSMQLMSWLKKYYPASIGAITSQFLPSNLLLREATRPSFTKFKSEKSVVLPALTTEQHNAVSTIIKEASGTWLLHGVTGSGKTRVYLELIKEALRDGKHCLILTPEIGLTSQLTETIASVVSAPTIVLHSGQSGKERRDAWLNVLYATEPVVVVGPRSALFAPFTNLGLIVVDEAHDGAYKQEQAPHYHALRVASYLALLHKARLVFGSATPLVTEYYLAEQKNIPILRLQRLATTASNTTSSVVTIVDQKDRSLFHKNGIISDTLIDAIGESLHNHEQSLVFLNRRGTARLIACQSCGWQAVCPKCDLPLTYHADQHIMRCHTCGHKQVVIMQCPDCKSTDIVYKSAGTKALADSLSKLFPHARIQRFDTDNLKTERLDALYNVVKSGEVDILVGTQVLIKGHDLPGLGTVGVIAADASLNFPDYTAEEQTFQLLTQVIGRVGRGHRSSNVVIQTFNSSALSLNAAVNKNWDEFYKQQLTEREHYLFPPFCFVLKLICRRKSSVSAEQTASKLAKSLATTYPQTQVLGPSPSFVAKTNNYFSWQIIIKSKQRGTLLEIIEHLPANWSFDIDPINLL